MLQKTFIIAKELLKKSIVIRVGGWMDEKQCQHDVTIIIAN
jgi:hypothetical protein